MRSGREHRPWWSTPPSAAWYEVTPLPRQVRSGQIVDGSVLLGEGASALVVDAPLARPPKRNTAERGIGLGGRRLIPGAVRGHTSAAPGEERQIVGRSGLT